MFYFKYFKLTLNQLIDYKQTQLYKKPKTIKKSCQQSELKRQNINSDVEDSNLGDVVFILLNIKLNLYFKLVKTLVWQLTPKVFYLILIIVTELLFYYKNKANEINIKTPSLIFAVENNRVF